MMISSSNADGDDMSQSVSNQDGKLTDFAVSVRNTSVKFSVFTLWFWTHEGKIQSRASS